VNVSAGADVEVSTEPVDVVVSTAGADVVDAAFVVTVAAGALGLATGAPIVGPAAGMSAASAVKVGPSTGDASVAPVRPVPARAVNARRRIQRRCARATRADGWRGAPRVAAVADLVALADFASLLLRDGWLIAWSSSYPSLRPHRAGASSAQHSRWCCDPTSTG
jgi:hypothetical protein